jgi:hypothetical protein
MLIYSDLITGDELMTDALGVKDLGNGIFEVESMRIVVGDDDIDIGRGNEFVGGDPDEGTDDTKETVLNIVHRHELKEQESMDKKTFKTLIKAYFPKLKEKLEKEAEDAETDWEKEQVKIRYDRFKKNYKSIQAWVKDVVLANWDEFVFYTGESQSYEGMIIPARYIGDAETPQFYFYIDGLKEEKA